MVNLTPGAVHENIAQLHTACDTGILAVYNTLIARIQLYSLANTKQSIRFNDRKVVGLSLIS